MIAFLYASVGHGGASGYIAILTLFGVALSQIKTSVLVLNVVVSLIAFIYCFRFKHFNLKLFVLFAITSIPAAFIGASYAINDTIFKKMLGIVLVFPVLGLIGIYKFGKSEPNSNILKYQIPIALMVGAVIGFLSGMLGIGGGILLTPFLLALRWADLKTTAGVSALFIFVNSLSGLISLLQKPILTYPQTHYWLLVAIFGGALGSFVGNKHFNIPVLRYILAFVLVIASVKLILT
jgi:uncharacterized protein